MIWKLYIIHFNRQFKHARHYVGIAKDPNKRLRKHLSGHGAMLLKAVIAAGIKVRINIIGEFKGYSAAHLAESALKKRHNTKHYCPICIKKKEKKI